MLISGAWEILACLMNGGTLHLRGSDWKATLQEVQFFFYFPLLEYPSIVVLIKPKGGHIDFHAVDFVKISTKLIPKYQDSGHWRRAMSTSVSNVQLAICRNTY